MQLPPDFQIVVERFVAACQADQRVSAAFLTGSYARGTADTYSDLDLAVIIDDEAYDNFIAGRDVFLRLFGDLLFLEDFGLADIVFFIFSDGVEGELGFNRASDPRYRHSGPFEILLDKRGLLAGVVSSEVAPDQARQIEMLRRQLLWFWHELSHFITAIGRGQLWWAHGQLEALRHCCLNLARLKQNFLDGDVGEESYFKIERAVPIEELSSLRATFCPLEEGAMLHAAREILQFYRERAPVLAHNYNVSYPEKLEQIMSQRLETLCEARLK